MLKNAVLACVLAVATTTALAAPAKPNVVNFSYTGFYDELNGGAWNPDLRLEGSFNFNNANGDNVITKNEAYNLVFNGRNYYHDCNNGNIYMRCGVDVLEYSAAGGLNISAYFTGSYPDETYFGRLKTGDSFAYTYYHPFDPGSSSISVRWSPDTKLTISPVLVPVPEPETYAMLLLGLAGIGWMQRRRRAI
ncbi:PEP-CTERM protein-sorting domain-containing protein/MYXO-CTERM domain-containing protein [Janthinobacterium lividum]|uniref:PEP-CTERM protein-sorting domain-containing protein/MYXO-CTERM domain-containing protein n=1 Tax=Janthinobacterium lividum TaxID=29581 RepID=A0AB38C4Q3_9BURK|nr:PEP-CTERM sorting domain-containing protein [Janthinobacterium lividum]SFX26507.1 PEP-CTERM protein-sorting domain-containing protein/MYXO-CTERM domain-containing protein [Janthinobacterium lividum]